MTDGEYEQQVDEDQKSKKRGRKAPKKAKGEEEAEDDAAVSQKSSGAAGAKDEEDPRTPADGGNAHQASSGNVADDTAVYIPNKTHYLMLGFLATTLICLLAIVPSRSLGTGKYLRSSSGYWDFCVPNESGGTTCIEPTATGNGPRVFGGVMSIFAILLTAGMIGFEVMEFMRPGRFAFFLKAICGMHHALWVLLLIAWACWAGWRNNLNSALDDLKAQGALHHQYYAWGFIFLIFMWLIHMFLAVLWTMKIVKKGVVFGF